MFRVMIYPLVYCDVVCGICEISLIANSLNDVKVIQGYHGQEQLEIRFFFKVNRRM